MLAWTLPVYTLPDSFITAMNEIGSTVYSWNVFIPVDSILICIILLLGFEVMYWAIIFATSMMNWIRGSGEINILNK